MTPASLIRKKPAAQWLEEWCDIVRACRRVSRGKNHAGSPEFHENLLGNGAGGNAVPGRAMGATQGAKKITKEMIDNAAAIADVPIADDTRK